jgi:hypothetical protein
MQQSTERRVARRSEPRRPIGMAAFFKNNAHSRMFLARRLALCAAHSRRRRPRACVSLFYAVSVCFCVLCNRHWFNRVPGAHLRIACLVTLHPYSDAGCADLPLAFNCWLLFLQEQIKVIIIEVTFWPRAPGQSALGRRRAAAGRSQKSPRWAKI